MTKRSLSDALAGESQAHMKYLAFAEQVHVTNYLRSLGAAIEGETFEVEEMYPAYDAIEVRQVLKEVLA